MQDTEKTENALNGQPGALKGEQAETEEFLEIQRLREELRAERQLCQTLMKSVKHMTELIQMLGVYGPTGSHLSGGTP